MGQAKQRGTREQRVAMAVQKAATDRVRREAERLERLRLEKEQIEQRRLAREQVDKERLERRGETKIIPTHRRLRSLMLGAALANMGAIIIPKCDEEGG